MADLKILELGQIFAPVSTHAIPLATGALTNAYITIGDITKEWVGNVDAKGFDLLNVGGIQINNPLGTFQYIITPNAIIADRILGLPILTGNDIFVFEAFAQPLTNKTITLGGNTITGTAAQFDTAVTDDNFAFVSDNLSVFAATTSLQLLGVISDETGTGLLVFNDTPTIITPTIASFVNATHDHQAAAGGGTLLSTSALSDTADIAYLNTDNIFLTNTKQTFTHQASKAGIALAAVAGDVSAPNNGEFWYNLTTNKFRARENGSTVDMIGGGGEVFTWTADHSMATFKLTATAANDVILNAPTGQGVSIEVAAGQQYLFNATEADYLGNNIRNVGFYESNAASPAQAGVFRAGNAEAGPSWRNAAGTNNVDIVVSAGDAFLLRINGTTQYTLSASALTMNANNLILNGGLIEFDNTDTTIDQVAGALVYDVAGTFAHDFRVANTIELKISASALTLSAGNNILMSGSGANGFLEVGTITTPSTPANGFGRYYTREVATVTTPFFKGDDGVEIDLGAGGGGGEANTIASLGGGTVLTAAVPKSGVQLQIVSIATTAPLTHSVTTDLLTFDINDLVNADISATAAIVLTKLQDIATARLLGRQTAATGAIEEISLNATLELVATTTLQRAALTGDVTASAGSNTTTVASVPDGALSSNVVLINQANTFGDFVQTFKDNALHLENPAGTFDVVFQTSAEITSDRILTIPLLGGNRTMVVTGLTSQITIGTEVTGASTALTDTADIAYLNQANTFGAFLNSFVSSTMRLPLSATPTMAVDGDFAIDTLVTDFSHGIIKYFDGEELGVVSMPIAEFVTPAAGAVPTYNATNDEFEMVVPSGTGDMILASAQTNTGIKTFLDTTMKLRNVANTFDAFFVNTVTADRILTIPDAAGTIIITGLANQITNTELTSGAFAKITGVGTIVSGTWEGTVVASAFLDSDTMHLSVAQTVTGKKIFGAPAAVGDFAIAGTTSGSTVIDATAVASGVLTIPAATDTLVARDTTDVLTNKTMDGDLNTFVDINETQMNVSVGAATTVLTSNGVGAAPTYQTAAGGEFTGAWTANHNNGGSTFALEDALFADPTDDTKQLQINLVGMTTGIIAILDFNFTTAKTITFPDATDDVVLEDFAQILTNKTITAAANTLTIASTDLTDTADIVLETQSNTYATNTIQTFTPDASNGGINVGSFAGEPTGANGELVYDSTANQMKGFVNGAWVDLGQSGSEVTTWTADHSTGGNTFLLPDDATPTTGVTAIYAEDGEINFNVTTGNNYEFKFNDANQLIFSAGTFDLAFGGSTSLNLAGTGTAITWDSSNRRIFNNTTGFIFEVETGDNYNWQIQNSSEMTFDVANGLKIQRRFQELKGANIVSPAGGILTLGNDGNSFLITGTNTINEILATNWQQGSVIHLTFDNVLTITNNSGGTNDILTANGSNITTASGDYITFVFEGTDWREISRSSIAAGGGDMILASAQTNSGIKTFLDTTMKLRNVANTFDAFFVNTVSAERIYTLPDVAGTVSLITATESPTNKTFDTTSIFTAADGLTLFTGLGIQAQTLDMGNNQLTMGTGTILFGTGESISIQTGDMIFDVPTTDFFSWDIAGAPEMTLTAAALTLVTNNLILTAGFLQFSDVNTTITDATGILQYDVASTFSHDFRINNTIEAQLTNLIFNLPNAAFQEAGIPISPIGLHDMFADGGSFAPIDSGGLVKRTIGSGANQKGVVVSAFATAVVQYAVTKVTVPENYDGGTITVVISWTSSVEGSGTVEWEISAVNVSDGDDLAGTGTNYGTAIAVTDTQTTLNFEQKTSRTAAITPANTYVAGDTMYIKVARDGVTDTFDQSADLLGISVRFGIDTAVV